jgi:hypothetical protein
MKAKIDGFEREGQVVTVPKGAFYVSEGLSFPIFPLFCFVCEPMTKKEKSCGSLLICPICDRNGGYAIVEVQELKNEVFKDDLRILLEGYQENYKCNAKEAIEDIVACFEMHGTPFSYPAKKYIEEIYEEQEKGGAQ